MCRNPVTTFSKSLGREITFACRRCNACLASRRRGWVARAMAEKATSVDALVFTLTYNDETELNRDGAAMFRYADVRRWLARLRRDIAYNTEQTGVIRFLAAGEQGERNGRCHWHVVIFADADVLALGEWSRPSGPVTERADKISGGKAKRLSWSLWPHGMVTVQEPDEGGMRYAITYALKDQMAADNSAKTARAHKVETFATGCFRMSKSPPIGAPYIAALLADLGEGGNVLPKVVLKVPGLSRPWYPSGQLRAFLLSGLAAINDARLQATGNPAPQWNSLLVSCADNETDLENLGHGQESEEEEPIETRIRRHAAEGDQRNRRAQIARQCGSTYPCNLCLNGEDDAGLARLGLARTFLEGGAPFYFPKGSDGSVGIAKQQSDCGSRGINPACKLNGTKSRRDAFPHSARQTPFE